MDTKRCSGYKGVWACGEDYPDHEVPVENFGPSGDGLQGRCRKCMGHRDGIRNSAISALEAYAKKEGIVADQGEWRALSKVARAEIADKFNKSELGAKFTVPTSDTPEHGAKIVPIFKRDEPQGKPMRTREPSEMQGEFMPQGRVSVVQNPDIPHIIKIGKTYPDGMGSIMYAARRYGRAVLVEKHYFDEAEKAEKAIQTILRPFNMRVLGYEDCGKELFKCSVNCFRKALREYQEELENADEVG